MNSQSLSSRLCISLSRSTLWILVGCYFALPCSAAADITALNITELVARAHNALANGQGKQAAEWFEQAASMGESAPAEIGLVRAYLQTGEFRKAVSFSNLTAAEHPDVSETAALLGYLEDREGQTTPALNKLKDELSKHPDDVALFGAQTEILIDRLAVPQAIRQLDEWINRHPPQADILRLRARAALAAGKRDEVINWRRKAALAYQAQGDLASAQVLADWLSRQGTDFSLSEPTTQTPTLNTDNTYWPAFPLTRFPALPGPLLKTGNGFIVDAGRQVMTNANQLAGASSDILIRNGLGEIRHARLEKILPEQGMALLRLDTPYPATFSLLNPSFNTQNAGHFCFVLSYPVLDELETAYPLLSPGVLVRPDIGIGGLMQISSALGQETSGAAVFDAYGQLIGMTLGKQEPLKDITDWETQFGKGVFAIRGDTLKTLLPSIQDQKKTAKKPKLSAKQPLPTPSVEELYEKLLPSVVTILTSH